MASKTGGSSSNSRRSHGEEGTANSDGLLHKLKQLERQIQGEREVSIKEKVDNNRKKLLTYVPGLLTAASSGLSVCVEDNGTENLLSSRISSPPCKFNGFKHGMGDKDYTPSKDVILTSIKLPQTEQLPPYTTWIFLDRNQKMAEDQSVVGRRQIYYDQQGGETLICSDSDEDKAEPEEEKHDFCDGEDRIIWMIGHEYGLGDEVLQQISQFLHVNSEDIMERYNELKLKNEHDVKDCADSGSNSGISLQKSLSAALDSFDNLFCRRCLVLLSFLLIVNYRDISYYFITYLIATKTVAYLVLLHKVFDCRLHGCSQTLVDPTEKQPYWSESESDRKPCSKHCYLRLQASKDIPEVRKWTASKKNNTASEEDQTMVLNDMEEPEDAVGSINLQTIKKVPSDSELVKNWKIDAQSLISESFGMGEPDHETLRKRDTSPINESKSVLDDSSGFSNKKQKTALVFGTSTLSNNSTSSVDQTLGVQKVDIEVGASEVRLASVDTPKDPESVCAGGSSNNQSEKSSKVVRDAKMPKLKQSSIEWKPVEKELYLKGVEIFGRNSCLIARNLLSGLKTCIEVSSYMCGIGSSVLHRSGNPNSSFADNDNEGYGVEQEMPTRTRLFRRRGKARKLKYSTKSAGHPSHWKRITLGKNQSCKQYTPCGCLSMCGKECPCLTNETCCEKYCGCSKSCKNRFRGCHCAKSQCRSRQCPCFAAGRECDPDVCRNCWVSCGDGTLGEPSRRGEGQCGNMRLLLRQQQRILLGKSDVAGWGAFLKNSVNKNEYLGEYTGELISHKEADKRGKIYDRANSSFLFDLNDQYVLDAHRKGDKLKFANHSSKPNCYAKVMFVAGDHRVGIFANERIEASEEIFYDYHYGPDQAPAWTKKPDGSKKDDSSNNQRRARKHQSH